MPNKPSRARPFFYRLTEGIRITVRPCYVAERSEPDSGRYLFTYGIRIENIASLLAQLLTRHWLIHSAGGEEIEVEGAGVLGRHPLLSPGSVHEYQSHCILSAPRGWMEGRFRFVRPDGSTFEAAIPRFDLEP